MEPDKSLMSSFKKRGDNQITSLEILSIALGELSYNMSFFLIEHSVFAGLSTFAEELQSRDVVIWSDNSGAESATRRGKHCECGIINLCSYVCLSGATKQFDQNSLIHAIWHHLARLKIHVWVERVPTKLNIADLPSRESYDLLNRIGAKWVPAHLGVAFRNAQTWESLSILGLK